MRSRRKVPLAVALLATVLLVFGLPAWIRKASLEAYRHPGHGLELCASFSNAAHSASTNKRSNHRSSRRTILRIAHARRSPLFGSCAG